jgi:hypothetical protein
VVSTVAGALLSAVFLGLPLIVLGSLAARGLGALHRGLGRGLLRTAVSGPARFQADAPGFLSWLRSGLTDPPGWRARGFLLLQLPVALALFLLAVVLRAVGLDFLAAPVFWRLYRNSPHGGLGGFVHHPVLAFGGLRFDTAPRVIALSAFGLLLLAAVPWAVHSLVPSRSTCWRCSMPPTTSHSRCAWPGSVPRAGRSPRSEGSEQPRLERVAATILAGPASLFALIAVANILVMSHSRRGPEFAGLVLLGGSAGLVLRMVVVESLVLTALGSGLAALLVAAGLGSLHLAQAHTYEATAVRVPSTGLGLLVLGCLTVSMATGLLLAGRRLHRPAVPELTARD